MHDLWHLYWHGAVNTGPHSLKLHRLALSIIQIREQGVLVLESKIAGIAANPDTAPDEHRRNLEGKMSIAEASDGTHIWTNLPFLVDDMTTHWTNHCATLSSAQRLTGAQFLTHLAAAGAVDNDALSGIALIVLRDTLETSRSLGSAAFTEMNQNRHWQDLTVANLLLAAKVWLLTTGRMLVQLSDDEWDECSADVGRLGELVVISLDADPSLEVPSRGRFNPQRWMWWLRRLREMADFTTQEDKAEKVGQKDRSLVNFVHGVMDNMMLIAEKTKGPVVRMLRSTGGAVMHQS